MTEKAPRKPRARKPPSPTPEGVSPTDPVEPLPPSRTPEAAAPVNAPATERAPRMYGNLFRSSGELAVHECPNGHGATTPVAPDHTWCGQCLRHWTVVPGAPADVT